VAVDAAAGGVVDPHIPKPVHWVALVLPLELAAGQHVGLLDFSDANVTAT
jgi:hypothetical protein